MPTRHYLVMENACFSTDAVIRATHITFLAGLLLVAAGCSHHPLTDYRPLVKVGMGSATMEQLKKLDTSDAETLQLVSAKQAGITDDTCVALVSAAHQHRRSFTSAEAVNSLAGAGFAEPQILEIARLDKLDTLSGDAVTLRLIGLSDSTVQTLLQRHLEDQPTLSSGEIARLKNVGLTESQVLERINQGMTDEQAEKEIKARETARNHYNTGFTHIRGRRSR
jgi:hypothetical protein